MQEFNFQQLKKGIESKSKQYLSIPKNQCILSCSMTYSIFVPNTIH